MRIAVVTRDPTGPELGGNAMRATELARSLTAHGDVTLVAPGSPPPAPVAHAAWDPEAPRTLRPLLAGADAVVSTPQSPEATAELRRCGARLVLDLYDPFPLAALEAHAAAAPLRRRLHTTLAGDAFLEGMRTAHHLICATSASATCGSARCWPPGCCDRRPTTPTRRCATGSTSCRPACRPSRRAARGTPLSERFGDEVVLWYGGLWNWLDPVTPVRALPALLERRPGAHLAFLGKVPAEPPSVAPPTGRGRSRASSGRRRAGALPRRRRTVRAARRVADRRRLRGLRPRAHLETRFAFRTRMLDFIWAGLPVVCTEGDALSELVARDGLGEVVAPGDHEGIAEALARVLETGRDAYAGAFAGAAEAFAWPRVTAPLARMVTAAELPPRLGEAALVPALPGPASRALLTRALRGTARRFSR